MPCGGAHQSRHDGRIEADDPNQLGPGRLQGPEVKAVVVRRGQESPASPSPAERRDRSRVGFDNSADAPDPSRKQKIRHGEWGEG